MIERPADLDGLYSCTVHPTFRGTEWDAALHLRTVHSALWADLKALEVTRVAQPQPV